MEFIITTCILYCSTVSSFLNQFVSQKKKILLLFFSLTIYKLKIINTSDERLFNTVVVMHSVIKELCTKKIVSGKIQFQASAPDLFQAFLLPWNTYIESLMTK